MQTETFLSLKGTTSGESLQFKAPDFLARFSYCSHTLDKPFKYRSVRFCPAEIGRPCYPLLAVSGERIVGGSEARPGQFPWQVGIWVQTSERKSFCGGSVLTKNVVVTAAHCAQ